MYTKSKQIIIHSLTKGLGLCFGLFVCFPLVEASEHKNGMQDFVMSIENELNEYLPCQNCTRPVKNDKFC